MPYKLKKEDDGWVVVSTDTGKKHSKRPLTRAMAKRQMKALYANVKDAK